MPSPTPTRSQDSSTPANLDFRALYQTLRERVWLIGLCLLTALAVTSAYLYRTPKTFAAKVVLQVEQEEQKVINIQRVQKEDFQSQEYLKTVEQTLQNRALLERVLETNHLASNPAFLGQANGPKPGKEQLINKLSRTIEVKLRKGTRLIDVVVENQDPELTELIANSLVAQFMRQNFEQNSTASRVANQFLSDEAEGLRKKLEASENALQGYREQMSSVSLEDRQNIVVQKLKDLSQKATEAKALRIAQESAYKRMLQASNDLNALLGIPAVATDIAVIELRSSVTKQEIEFANLKEEYKPKHPKYIQAESQLTELRRAFERSVLTVPETVRAGFENAKATETALEDAMHEQETAALELNKQAITYGVLQRDVESNRALFQSVINRIKETDLTKDLKVDKIRVVQPATIPENPVRPKKLQVLMLGVLAGLGAGLFLALFLNAIDWSLNTVDQAEEYLGLPVLSAVPRCHRGGKGRHEAESFRTLRTAIALLGPKDDRRTFLFTSALPEEGKTFCSINFAASLAQQSLRTVIIDGDLRRPMVERSLRRDGQAGVGVTEYLSGQKDFQAVIQPTELANLSFISSGTEISNPAELLAEKGIDGLVTEALRHFDRVIVDSAPVQAVSDTVMMLKQIQTVCLVVRAHKTPKHVALRAVQQLKQAGAPIGGIILNRLTRHRNHGYYYGSYYEYSYSKGYSKPVAAVG